MDPSKFKLEVYDLLGIILPGLLVICEGWIFLRSWTQFVNSLSQLGGTEFAVLTLLAFGAGNLVQELGDLTIKKWKGDRYFKRARDRFWRSDEAHAVKAAIKSGVGQEVTSVDTAFDYCLTKLRDLFGKRDLFVATSDLCRSLAVLSVLALIPTSKVAWQNYAPGGRFFAGVSIFVAFLIFLAWLSWRRMVRFRELSDLTVFRSYLAMLNQTDRD